MNPVLKMQKSKIVRTRNRFRNAENIFRKKIAFEISTSRQFFQFERVAIKIVTNDDFIRSKIKRIIEQTNSTFERKKK